MSCGSGDARERASIIVEIDRASAEVEGAHKRGDLPLASAWITRWLLLRRMLARLDHAIIRCALLAEAERGSFVGQGGAA